MVEVVNVVTKFNENEQSKDEYRNKVLSTYKDLNTKIETAEYLNGKAKFEATYQDMYKWIYGWKDPENYPAGRGFQVQELNIKPIGAINGQ